jgi:YVTN family beta-propeller protein
MNRKHGWSYGLAIGVLLLSLQAGGGAIPAVRATEETERYLGPCALAASADARTLYVACADARQVAWVALPGGEVLRRVAVPGEPSGVALSPDGTKLIVTCAAPNSVIVVLDAASGQILATIPAGHTAVGATLSPDGTRLYVCNRFENNVSVIDLLEGKQLARVAAVREPVAAAVTGDGRTVVVANHLPNTRTDAAFSGDSAATVSIFDAQTFATTVVDLPDGSNGLRGICTSPDGTHAFATHLLSNFRMVPFRVDTGWINVNVVSIIDVPQRKLLATIGLDEFYRGASTPWDVACTADGKWVCVSLSGTHELNVIDRADLLGKDALRTMSPMMGVWPIYPSLGASLWRRIQLPGNGPRGLAIAGAKVYVAEYFSDTIAVVDLAATGDEGRVGSIALGPSVKLTPRRRGEMLFHDATLCYQHWQSCASCHPDARVDGLNWDLMNDGVGNPKNTKSMILSHVTPPSMAEGVRMTAEEAVRSGFTHILFSVPPEQDAADIDTYLKSLPVVPSPYLVDGRLSPSAERGRQLFHSQQVGCHICHPAPLYTDLKPHNVGTRSPGEFTERFDTPTLIEVWRTAPYLHDGRYTTIRELLVDGRHGLSSGRLEALSEQEIQDLVEFVLSL